MAQSLWSLAAIPVAFAVFVYQNGGVVVGDKAHHVPVQHYMQIPYLLLFTAGCLAAMHFTPHRCLPSVLKPIYSRRKGCRCRQEASPVLLQALPAPDMGKAGMPAGPHACRRGDGGIWRVLSTLRS